MKAKEKPLFNSNGTDSYFSEKRRFWHVASHVLIFILSEPKT